MGTCIPREGDWLPAPPRGRNVVRILPLLLPAPRPRVALDHKSAGFLPHSLPVGVRAGPGFQRMREEPRPGLSLPSFLPGCVRSKGHTAAVRGPPSLHSRKRGSPHRLPLDSTAQFPAPRSCMLPVVLLSCCPLTKLSSRFLG